MTTKKFLGIGCFLFAILWGVIECCNFLFNGDKPIPFYGNAFVYICLAYLLLEKK